MFAKRIDLLQAVRYSEVLTIAEKYRLKKIQDNPTIIIQNP